MAETLTDTSFDLTGWAFSDAGALEWQPMGEGVAMKMLAAADGKVIALFKFEPGYVGGSHHHEEAEFTYVMEGDLVSNGVEMQAGHAYGAQAGTDHEEFRSVGGATVVSVFKLPG
ncbi:MAG: cupin domain-containing protein [Actinomycetota bacterium]